MNPLYIGAAELRPPPPNPALPTAAAASGQYGGAGDSLATDIEINAPPPQNSIPGRRNPGQDGQGGGGFVYYYTNSFIILRPHTKLQRKSPFRQTNNP